MRSTPVLLFLLFLSGTKTEEQPTPSRLLAPRNFNHHSYDIKQYLKTIEKPEPTKQGPVLFPNDGPPAPRLPLVVTSRPLLESIANSDLNPNPPNNSVAEQSRVNHVAFKPDFYTGLDQYQPQQYQPVAYTVAPIPDYGGVSFNPGRVPYADIVNKARGNGATDNRYNDYEERTSLPPIYKALSDYAQNKVLKTKQKPEYHDYKSIDPDYIKSYENNEIADGQDNGEYNQGDNYAFSYSVKDRKTGDDFSHRQHSSGSATNGEYRVRLPDGRMQIVSYTADENGYKADVRYDNDIPDGNHVETTYTDHKENQIKNYDSANSKSNLNNDYNFNSNSHIDNDYTQRDFNIKPVKEDYYNPYTDASKEEYYNDYSAEYPTKYETHRSKFTAFKPTVIPNYSTTVRPSYEEVKNLFTTKPFDANANYLNNGAVEINGPSTPTYEGVTENVVVIAPKLYTHVRSSTPFADTVVTTPKPFIVTPASYLASTIATLRDRIKSSKPILSQHFINRINKYLTFT